MYKILLKYLTCICIFAGIKMAGIITQMLFNLRNIYKNIISYPSEKYWRKFEVIDSKTIS